MSVKYLLFDLDGTLLPMDQDLFVKAYFGRLAKKLAPYGYDAQGLIASIWQGVGDMVANDGSKSNEVIFWDSFASRFGDHVRDDMPIFEEFYQNEFQQAKESCGYNQQAVDCIHELLEQGWPIYLATNPIFPAVATHSRIRWAGLQPEDFQWITTYENTSFCKPNPLYYQDLVQRIGCKPEECLMIGNDVEEDMIARTVGLNVFLITDCLINTKNKDINQFPHGSFNELLAYINKLK